MRRIESSSTAPFNNVISIVEIDNDIVELHENVNDILLRGDNQYQGWQCWSGIESLFIDHNGDVYAASCKQTKLGNVFTGFNLPSEPVTCIRTWCVCAASLNITKTKQASAQQYLKKFTDGQS